MTPNEELGVLDYCIERLEAKHKRGDQTENRHASIIDIVQVLREMRVAIVLREGVSDLDAHVRIVGSPLPNNSN